MRTGGTPVHDHGVLNAGLLDQVRHALRYLYADVKYTRAVLRKPPSCGFNGTSENSAGILGESSEKLALVLGLIVV
jgi:hypothetical protein